MHSLDGPKYRGQSLLAAWKGNSRELGLPLGDWAHCDIRGQQCHDFRAVYRNLSYLAAPDCEFHNATFAHCNLNHADLQRCKLTKGNFVSCHLEQARLNASDIRNGTFAHAHLRSASFQRTILHRVNFRFCNLHHANFQQADLRWADLRGANLSQTRLEGSSLIGCAINAQTAEASGWRNEAVEWWIKQGAEWSETTVEATRWHTGVDLETKRHTSFNVLDALPLLFSDLGDILVAGQPPTLFIAGLNIHSTALTERIQQIATYSDPLGHHSSSKWAPIHQWIREGGTISEWTEIDNNIVFASRLSF